MLTVLHEVDGQLQQNLNKIQKRAIENGLKFSKSKTVCMHCCHLRKAHYDPVLTLDGTPIGMHCCHLRKAHYDPVLTLDGTPIPVVKENIFKVLYGSAKKSYLEMLDPIHHQVFRVLIYY